MGVNLYGDIKVVREKALTVNTPDILSNNNEH
jgi:hypothetical protein